jgi:thiol-disulfide isomerase/thioredoxin
MAPAAAMSSVLACFVLALATTQGFIVAPAAAAAVLARTSSPAAAFPHTTAAAATVAAPRRTVSMMAGLADRSTAVLDLAAAPITQVMTTMEYRELLAANPDKLIVTKWYADFCRSCKAMDLKYKKLAIERPDVIFVAINVAESKELKQAHGVNVIPQVHMHAGHLGLVESFTCGPSKMPTLARKVYRYANVQRYIASARGGLMEKLTSFSAGVGTKLSIPSLPTPTQVSASSKGIMEKLAELERSATQRQRSLSDLSIMIG